MLQELRTKHPKLIYKAYQWSLIDNNLEISFDFSLKTGFAMPEDAVEFHPKVTIFDVSQEMVDALPADLINNYVFHLGLAELPSYWKATCSPEIIVEAGHLSDEQKAWWHDLFINGLGEFFFENDIDFTAEDFLKISSTGERINLNDVPSSKTTKKYLVPIGGGKDSALTAGIFDKNSMEYGCLLLEPHSPSSEQIIEKSQTQETIRVKRVIDPKLLELNNQGYLNGHTPFSAYLAFLSSVVGRFFGYEHIVLSNEHSANEGNAEYRGKVVNHQYSKTYDFELKFSQYSEQYLKASNYFSLMRPLYELQIAKLFSNFEQFHSVFRSCNVGQQQGVWCHHCPKCLFVFTMLFPFVETDRLISEIFSKNLFEDENQLSLARELAGLTELKPFECVGTHEEVLIAFYLAIQKHQLTAPGQPLPVVLEKIEAEIIDASVKEDGEVNSQKSLERRAQKLLNSWNSEHKLEENLEQLLRSELLTDSLKDKFSNKSITILGLGREGQSTYEFLRSYLPEVKLTLADGKKLEKMPHVFAQKIEKDPNTTLNLGENYLSNLNSEIIFKTAGIPATTPEIKATIASGAELYSNTKLFFELCPGKIIGITGTKGKSTTSSLIHHVLKTAELDTVLVGNIGEPPLASLEEISSETLVVNELSSHQLAELNQSPEVAVVQMIASEHLDYYATTEEYVQAKSAITRFQLPTDTVIYCSDLEGSSTEIANLSPGENVAFSLKSKIGPAWIDDGEIKDSTNESIIDISKIKLPGHHNLYNIMPAVIIGKIFKVENESIAKALKSFKGLPHRLEFVDNVEGVDFYNDSLATNPEATKAAVQSFPDRAITLIAGGHERHQDFSKLAQVILEENVQAIVLFPTTGARLKQELEKLGADSIKFFDANNMETAVKLAKENTPSGGVVLMSPASASFGLFEDYAQRGVEFGKAVKS